MNTQIMTTARPKTRLFVDATLEAGAQVSLLKDQAHYVSRVMRQDVGASALLFNGHDGEWLAHISSISKTQCQLSLEAQTRQQQSEPDIWLVFAPIKKSRMDFMIEKATELGASRLLPVFTRNTDVSRVNVERLQATALESAEQCERLNVPQVDKAVDLDNLIRDWDPSRQLYIMDETGTGNPAIPAFSSLSQPGKPAAILIGPEGGFTASELDQLRDLAFVTPVTLGPRVLRAETAALTALASWQVFQGDGCAARMR
jgi:16S rRNA (uracil1498-N3)-methyltransferase